MGTWERGLGSAGGDPQVNPRMKNLALSGGAAVILAYLAWNAILPSKIASPEPNVAPSVASSPAPSVSPAGTVEATAVDAGVDPTRIYAVGLSELQGLSPDTPPGSTIDIWVAWDPPITKGPRVQRLLSGVTLEKIIEGATPEAPVTALLRIADAQSSDMIFGDRYGTLSVTTHNY